MCTILFKDKHKYILIYIFNNVVPDIQVHIQVHIILTKCHIRMTYTTKLVNANI